jgi:protease-4
MTRLSSLQKFAWTAVVVAAIAAASLPVPASAQDDANDPLNPLDRPGNTDIPSYYSLLDFNLTSPSTWATAVGGFANPGVYTMLPGGEGQFFWTDQNQDVLTDWRNWGLFLGGENIGFGTVYNRVPNPVGEGVISVTDYRLALSAGNKTASLGFAFGWSGKDGDLLGRTRVVQVGTVQRWTKYLSFGLAGIFSTEIRDQSGLFDVGVRPLGSELLSIFGDLELPRGVSLKNAPWSLGAMVEWPAGLRLIGRYYENETWDIAVAYAFGGGMGTGHVGLSAQPKFNTDSEVAYTNWGFRMGYPERGFIGQHFQKDRNYLSMQLKGPVVHTRYKYFDSGHLLSGIIKSLEDAKNDPRVKGVALNLSGVTISRGNAWEIREKLAELRENGKHVVVYVDVAGSTEYHLASVADRVVMDPEGMMLLPGYVLGRTYMAGTLEKIGIGFDEWRFLKYKSAAETFSRKSMSEADREQRQALVDGYYETLRAEVCASRGVSTAEFDRWVDEETIILPADAKDAGMIDAVARWDDIQEVVTDLEGAPKRFVGHGSLAGQYYKSRRWGEPPRIAVVYAIGSCSMDSGIRARQLEKLLLALAKSPSVKGVVLRVNSPGGSALASDLVAEAIKKCADRKPVIVSQGDVAASGGYWISMYADRILAQPTTITGSIGVIGGWIWNDGLAEKMGLSADWVQRGKHADLFFGPGIPFSGVGIPHRPMTEDERERVMERMTALYDGFVAKVAEGRKMSTESVAEIAQGRVWTGTAGEQNGLIDAVGGLDDAIKIAREMAGIDPDEEVKLLDLSIKGLFDFGGFSPSPIGFAFNMPWPWPWGWGGLEAGSDVDEKTALMDEFFDDYEMIYLRQIVEHNGRALCLIPPDFLPQEARAVTGAPDWPQVR